jgi:cytochrome b561
MALLSSFAGYGSLAKLFHWAIVVLFAFQYTSANIMTRLAPDAAMLGASQSGYYNWHKTVGLLALALAVGRLIVRRMGSLPPWAPTLTKGEQGFIMRAETVLYAAMFVMPVSGFLYVMAGGYGVLLCGLWAVPNPISEVAPLATLARWTHIAAGWVLLLTLGGHVGLVLYHTLVLRDGLLRRMLAGRAT